VADQTATVKLTLSTTHPGLFFRGTEPDTSGAQARLPPHPPASSGVNLSLLYYVLQARTTKRRSRSDFAAVAGWRLRRYLAVRQFRLKVLHANRSGGIET